MVSIQFLGAAGTVTGSKHLLRTPGMNILIDCGLFQGARHLRMKNWEQLPFPADKIDLVILTHAHLDHCGFIPLLVKSGYKGRIIMTPPTRDLTEIILRDSAKIQEEDALQANREGYSKHQPALPLYTEKDVEVALKQFENLDDDTWEKVNTDIRFRFVMNGHILGSAAIEMICHGKVIVFSGDLGRPHSYLLDPPETIPICDYLVMESTYGDRLHVDASAKDQLEAVIHDSIHQKGNLLIPSFAVGRAQELLQIIYELKYENRIPDLPVYLDSPMAASATDILQKYTSWHKLSPQECDEIVRHVHIITDFRDTRKVIANRRFKIVIAASGMLNGGRVLEYLRNYLENKANTILLVGFQAEGTRGRAMKEGAHEVKVFGSYYKVKARIRDITSLSAHGDQAEMIHWLKAMTRKPKQTFLVHGEDIAREAFRVKIESELGFNTICPMQNEEYELF